MKFSALSLAITVSAIVATHPASAQSQRPSRTKAVEQCMMLAHNNAPKPTDAADPAQNVAVNMYRSCMKKYGYRP
ncbi:MULTISPECIES: hypothetical protein [unclassified Beijerinckia]|uniref:hypothetical protein n=1 Tax=unclassified Beijerinckia TaxID=2638183 RepID=UPI0008973D63|nr:MULTISPECIES: hypothetical protein [unclassified Beijerinckia]MDH7799065.1 hypothetical protein [Beijerinckia sp. GAS462]SED96218.1 hypothetical protein SAMN05443249_6053 [Beijerinckia sp. 28-YEA-48]